MTQNSAIVSERARGPKAASNARSTLLAQAQHLRAANRVREALAALARLETLDPSFSRLHQERGHCLLILGNAQGAMEALLQAVRLNGTLPKSWDMLEQLYRMQGDPMRAAEAAQNLALLRQLPPEIVAANSLYADGDFDPAGEILRDYLDREPGNVGGWRLLARIELESGAPAEAEAHLQRALKLAPDYSDARFDYANVLLHLQRYRPAREQAEILLRHDPDNRDYLKLYGAACIGIGDHEPVIELYAKLLENTPSTGLEAAELFLWRANALKVTGRAADAIAGYHASLEARPDYGVAWFSLANLKTYHFSDSEIARMRDTVGRPDLAEMDRIYLCFALGKALEDRGDYASSWSYYKRGNSLRRKTGRYAPESTAACANRIKRVFTAEFFASRAGWGARDEAPIFIVGLPRSGSTLVEQILASHSEIEGTHELTEIARYAAELCGIDPDCSLPSDPAALNSLTATQARLLGERFLSETQVYRQLGRPFFIDKMPNNFWHIGLIHLILPRSTIIDVRREPLACCFSNFKQLFGTTSQEFTYDLYDIAHYYRTYLDIMRHWDDVLPQRVLRVQYADVVNHLEDTARSMLDRVGLRVEPACFAFHQNTRSVRTPSSEQVRQPLNHHGMTQWEHYSQWLDPLREQLGDALTQYRM